MTVTVYLVMVIVSSYGEDAPSQSGVFHYVTYTLHNSLFQVLVWFAMAADKEYNPVTLVHSLSPIPHPH
jgi:hypothetical protein